MVGLGQEWEESIGPNVRTSSSTLSEGGTVKLMCTPRILAEASLKAGVTALIRKIPEACSSRLINFVGSYTTSRGERLLQTLTLSLMMMEMVAIGPSPRLPLVSLFCMMSTVITSGGAKVHLAKVQAMML